MKICPLRAELLHTDGQADMKNLAVAFRNFANAPKRHNGLTATPLTTIEI
jgi:hypothetical protein